MRVFRLALALLLAVVFATRLAADEARPEKAFLWEVKSGAHRLYIIGGLTAGKRSMYPLPDAMRRAYEDAQVIAVEADSSDQAGAAESIQIGMYKNGDGLEKHIPAQLYQELMSVLLNYDIPETDARDMKPWLLYFRVIFLEFANAGYESAFSVDEVIVQRARANGKPVVAMNKVQEISRYLDSIPDDLQAALLQGLLVDVKGGAAVEILGRLWDAWRAGDTERFLAAVKENEGNYPRGAELYAKLFQDRHPEMLKRLEEYLKSGKTHLVVLGAVNLIGADGLVAKLKQQGYEITQR